MKPHTNIYKNKLTSLIRATKQNYYTDRFKKASSDQKKRSWNVLNEILGRNTKLSVTPDTAVQTKVNNMTKSIELPDKFNSFFASIGKNLSQQIYP